MATREEVLTIPLEEAPRALWWQWLAATGTFIRRKPLGAFGALVLILTVAVAVFSPWIARYPFDEPHFADALTNPNSTYWFGTDHLGRDFFSRVVIGAQVTVLVGLGTVLLAAVISLVVGGVSGYLGGWVDMVVQRFVDIWVALPAIFLLLTFVAVLGTGGDGFLGIGRGPDVGLQPRDGDWIWYTFFRSTVVIILATLNLGLAVLAEATISFLVFGIQAPFPTWGRMLADEGRHYGVGHEYLMIIPGAAIFIAVYGFNMLGDALRDILDPRLRGSR